MGTIIFQDQKLPDGSRSNDVSEVYIQWDSDRANTYLGNNLSTDIEIERELIKQGFNLAGRNKSGQILVD